MNTIRKIVAVIGQGFVGSSLTIGMQHAFDVYAYDKSGKLAQGAFDGLEPDEHNAARGGREHSDTLQSTYARPIARLVSVLEEGHRHEAFTDVYFVAVPTPMLPDGSADTSIVESVLDDLASQPRSKKSCRIAVIKSTCPPGTTEAWNKKYASTPLRVIFNPEFLTEANAVDDFRNQDRIVLGGPRPYINVVKQVFEAAFPQVQIVKTSSTTAEMVKYVTNVHLAVKVSLANEFCQICEALDANGLDIDYDKVMAYATLDKRLGTSHWKVPGPMPSDDTGEYVKGFAGSCFIKDLNALMSVATNLGIDPKVMTGAWQKNLEVRPQRDWEKLVGRAITVPPA